MYLTVSIIFGIVISILAFSLLSDEKSWLEVRLEKISRKERRYVKSIAKNIAEIVGGYGKDNSENKKQFMKNKLLLMQAGLDSNEDSILIYEGRKIILLFLVSFALLAILSFIGFNIVGVIVGLMILLVTYKFPEILLKQKIAKRQKEFVKNLPDAIDLLSICVKAGLGIDAALNRVANEFALTSKIVANEFERLNRDVLSGSTKQDAYRNMAIANPNPEVKSFVALLIQTDKLGTGITQSLDAYCDSVRTRKKQRIEELSQKAAGKMTIPMVLFMLPAIFIIILYPALIKIMGGLTF